MPFTIDQIKKRITPVRPNTFRAQISAPPRFMLFDATNSGSTGYVSKVFGNLESAVDATVATQSRDLKFRIEATEFPGRTIATADDTSFGPATSYAYDTTYNDINLTIIADENMQDRKFFDYWMEKIVENTSGNFTSKSIAGKIGYYDDIVGTMEIHQLDARAEKAIAKCVLHNAFPVQLSSMNLSWEEQNTYQRFTVTMSYRYHNVYYL